MNNKRRNEFYKELNKETNEINFDQFKDDIPTHLYRYRKVNSNNLSALLNNRLYFSISSYYDDPFDTLFCMDKKLLKKEISAILSDTNNDAKYLEFKNYMNIKANYTLDDVRNHEDVVMNYIDGLINTIQQRFKNDIYSICFSEGDLNQDLWLKYADDYAGFTIEYDTNALMQAYKNVFNQKNIKINDSINFIYPIVYSNKPFYANELFKSLIYRLIGMDFLIKDWNRFLIDRRRVCLVKNKFHSNDKEWRLFLDKYSDIPVYINIKPSSVILGIRISNSDKDLIKRICLENHIDLYETYISDEYKLRKRKVKL